MKIALGRYTGNGTDSRSITGVGFQPDFVAVKGGSALAVFRVSNHAGDVSKAFNGTGILSNCIQAVNADGFEIGTAVQVNTNGTSYDWMAVQIESGDCSLLTWSGNGADNRSITGAGFQPSLAVVYGTATAVPVWRTDTVSGDKSLHFGAQQTVADGIQALESDGIQVGTLNKVNASGQTYYALCVKAKSMAMETVTYTGDGADSRSITGAGFQPESVWLGQEDTSGATNAATWKASYQTTDTAHYFDNVAAAANLIQAFGADGFTVGSDDSANESGKTYHAVAWRSYGWVTPYAFAVNDVVTPEILNTYVSAPLQWLKDNPFDTANYGEAPLHASGTTTLELTGSWQDVPGLTVTLNGTGEWVIATSVHFQISAVSAQRQLRGQLLIGGTAQAGTVRFETPGAVASLDCHSGGLWTRTATGTAEVVKIQATRTLGGAGDYVIGSNCSLTAWRVSAP